MRNVIGIAVLLLMLCAWRADDFLGPQAIAARVVGPSSPELRELLDQLGDADARVRLAAAHTLASDLTVMEDDTLHKLKGKLQVESKDFELRCAVADIFGSYAKRKWHAGNSKIMIMMIAALQDCQRAQDPRVRICIANAAAEFSSDAVVPILEALNTDGNSDVREAAEIAIRRRQDHIDKDHP